MLQLKKEIKATKIGQIKVKRFYVYLSFDVFQNNKHTSTAMRLPYIECLFYGNKKSHLKRQIVDAKLNFFLLFLDVHFINSKRSLFSHFKTIFLPSDDSQNDLDKYLITTKENVECQQFSSWSRNFFPIFLCTIFIHSFLWHLS